MALALDKQEVQEFLEEVFPQVRDDFEILEIEEESCRVRLKTAERHLRPGGTVSGPSMFGLADCAFYVMVLARIGREALTVTTTCTIDFMRKPPAGPMICDTRLLKMGRSLAVGDCLLFAEGDDRPVARASLTYSIPPKPQV